MYIIIVAGLPGSGKSHWCKLQAESIGESAIIIDDPSVNPDSWLLAKPSHEYIFINDPYFCVMPINKIEGVLERNLPFKIEEAKIKWVCMENNLELSLKRARPNTTEFCKRLSKKFLIPESASILPNEGKQSPWWALPDSFAIIKQNKLKI